MSDRIAELEAALAAALERIDVLERSTGLAADPATPTVTVAEPVGPKAPRIDRRHLLTRGGTAAAGAVLGGVAATLATPGTAAAASTDGVFTSLEAVSDRVEVGSTLGFVDCGGESVPVLSPFRGRLVSVVAADGQRLAPHQRVAWLRAS